ncbi:MAG: DUF3119 family protein [Cyanobacteria bacterium P01_F01_bin.150]
MTNFFASSSVVDTKTELKPSFGVALGVIALGASIGFIQPWVSIVVGLFGVFLLIQTVVIRLVFTTSDLEVYRNQELIRSFPYEDWQNWRIFLGPLPVLFYFKEVKSIHFLPMLFSSKMLKSCLEKHNLPQT